MEKCKSVIQGLSVCDYLTCAREKCPYYEGSESEYWSNPDGYRCEFDLRQDAIILLKTAMEVLANRAITMDWLDEKIHGYASRLQSTELKALTIVKGLWEKDQEDDNGRT